MTLCLEAAPVLLQASVSFPLCDFAEGNIAAELQDSHPRLVYSIKMGGHVGSQPAMVGVMLQDFYCI